MKTAKWILTCALTVSMTAAIRAQNAVPDGMGRQSAELEMLVDIAEMDLLADMVDSLLREEDNADGNSIADSQMPEGGFAGLPGRNIDIYGGGFGMDGLFGVGEFGMGAFGGFPIVAGYCGMDGFGYMGGFRSCPMTGVFGGMGCLCGF